MTQNISLPLGAPRPPSPGSLEGLWVEDPCIDPNPIIRLFSRMDEASAEREICTILDAISLETSRLRGVTGLDEAKALQSSIGRICRRSGRIGMTLLSRVAGDVAACVEAEDHAGFLATNARMIRVADRSLTEIWSSTRSL